MTPLKEVLHLHFRGETVAQISTDLHMGRMNVYQILRSQGLKSNKYKFTRHKETIDHFRQPSQFLMDQDISSLPDDLSDFSE